MVMTHLILVNVTKEVERDSSGDEFERLIKQYLVECQKADNVAREIGRQDRCCTGFLCGDYELSNASSDKDRAEKIRNKLMRFIRVQDRYCHFGSMLLKSHGFHAAYGNTTPPVTLVELPRLQYGKPFIPSPEGGRSNQDLNVSHQFPFVGIAEVLSSSNKFRVGMDLVTFEHRSKDDDTFLKSFKSSFADSEWEAITNSNVKLVEFFLRWAMKEAYTKAIGAGLGLEFSSFETTLEGVDEVSTFLAGTDAENGGFVKGRVKRQESERTWGFFFLKLLGENQEFTGSSCVCIGPLPEDSDDEQHEVKIDWMTLQDLLDFHRPKTEPQQG